MFKYRKTQVVVISLLLTTLISNTSSASNVITERSNHKVVIIKVNEYFSVQLHSTYWTFDKLTGQNIKQIAAPVVIPTAPGSNAPGNCQIAGMGCGTLTWKLKAVAKGSTTVSASRTSCGEALRCTPEQSTYSVKIVVR